MKRITLIHPSRSRPVKSFLNAKQWFENATYPNAIELILSLDNSDPMRDAYYESYAMFSWDKDIMKSDSTTVVEATNNACRAATGDIMVYLSDDFKSFPGWDEAIRKEFDTDLPTLIKVDDCLQKFEVPVLTIPIMNRALYERLGYFFHPDFKSMFCDEHLYWVAFKLRALKFCPHIKFPHEHPANGKAPDDETYRRSAANWNQGKAAFAKHKALNFPV